MDNEELLQIYKKLYSIPEICYKEKIDENFFKTCTQSHFFVILCIFNSKKEFLIIRDIDKNIGWELVGGHLKDGEAIENAINRIAQKETGLTIDELNPICVVNNTFDYNNQKIQHRGIAFSALARGNVTNPPENIKNVFTNSIPQKIAYQNKDILLLAQSQITKNFAEPPYNEIDSFRKYHFCFKIHRIAMALFNHITTRKILKTIQNAIADQPQNILDVACGDDKTIFKLTKIYEPKFAIANDISWQSINKNIKQEKNNKLIFTNHNALRLPFKEKFDLVIFKNTLHHIPKVQRSNLLKKLLSISKQLIIIDIEDPMRTSVISKIWNWYYTHFLGDQGENFLTHSEFCNLIKNINKNIEFDSIKTVKGRYSFASIKNNSSNQNSKEVEVKIKIEQSQINKIKKILHQLKATPNGVTDEKDVYFTAPHRDFIKTRECLRIREKDDFKEITYKGSSTDEMEDSKQFWKQELNIEIAGSTSTDDIIKFFEMINFKMVAEVAKKREKYTLGNTGICIDEIKNLGFFVEIETMILENDDTEIGVKKNLELFEVLELDKNNIVQEPYRDLVIKRQAL